MYNPRNLRIKRMANLSGGMSNLYGSTLGGNIGANNTNYNPAAGSNYGGRSNMGGAPVQGATANPSLEPIKIILTNNYSRLLYYPMWNASNQYVVPFDGETDFITGLTPGTNEGIVAQFQTAPLAALTASILGSGFVVQRMLYDTGSVAEQLNDTWQIYTTQRSGSVTSSPFFPGDEQNLFQQVGNKIQVNGLVQVIDWSKTWFIPVEPDNIVTITFYVGSQLDPTMILKGQMPVQTNAIPNVLAVQ
jgi:hypothetical protein